MSERSAQVSDVHRIAAAMPYVTRLEGPSGNAVYQVGAKSFVFFRNPRRDAPYPDVIVIWVESETDKLALVQDAVAGLHPAGSTMAGESGLNGREPALVSSRSLKSDRSFVLLIGCLAAVPLALAPIGNAVPPPGSRCGVNLDAPQIALAALSLPPALTGLDAPWDTTPYAGNFDPCATLSTALVTVERGTGSSPNQALFFHHGDYLGTATSAAYPFTTFDAAQTTDDTVVLSYKDGRDVCTACAGPVRVIRYQWRGDHVQMLDPAPPGP